MCIFCNREENWFYVLGESYHWYAIADAHPVSVGHALLIPKKHVVSFFDLDQEQWNDLHGLIKDVKHKIETEDWKLIYQQMCEHHVNDRSVEYCQNILETKYVEPKPNGYNIGVNDGSAAGRTVEHVHIQMIPRYSGDVPNPTGGVRAVIRGLEDYQ